MRTVLSDIEQADVRVGSFASVSPRPTKVRLAGNLTRSGSVLEASGGVIQAANLSFPAFIISRLVRPGLLKLHLDHPLAAVFAGQQSDQRLRRILKAIDNVFLDFQFAGGDPGL